MQETTQPAIFSDTMNRHTQAYSTQKQSELDAYLEHPDKYNT